MKKKTFYEHLIPTESVTIQLDKLHLSPNERIHLTTILHSSIHTVVMDLVLSELQGEDKKTFLTHVYHEDHGEIWNLLHAKILSIEDKIKEAGQKTLQEFASDIEELVN